MYTKMILKACYWKQYYESYLKWLHSVDSFKRELYLKIEMENKIYINWLNDVYQGISNCFHVLVRLVSINRVSYD